jgi:hypothetical protein
MASTSFEGREKRKEKKKALQITNHLTNAVITELPTTQ